MREFNDAELMAADLRSALADRGVTLTDSDALDIVSQQFGYRSWDQLAAKIAATETGAQDTIRFKPAIPVLRIFNEDIARDFYLGFLGFELDWEYRHEAGLPVYAQVSRGDMTFHLTAHHGDATPGSAVFARVHAIDDYHRELLGRNYAHLRPNVVKMPWGLMMSLADPFGNHIRFCEQRSG